MTAMPNDPDDPALVGLTSDGAVEPAEPAQQIKAGTTAEAGSAGTEVASAVEVAPAGAASASQPQLDLTAEPIRSRYANVNSLHETRAAHRFRVGPMEVEVYIAERAEDTSIQAASTGVLHYAYGGLGVGAIIAVTSSLIANPSGVDLLLIGGGPGAGVFLIGVAINAYRIRQRRKKR